MAAGESGLALVDYLEGLTGVNVAASIDETGNERDGYNFVLETDEHVGSVHRFEPCYWAGHEGPGLEWCRGWLLPSLLA